MGACSHNDSLYKQTRKCLRFRTTFQGTGLSRIFETAFGRNNVCKLAVVGMFGLIISTASATKGFAEPLAPDSNNQQSGATTQQGEKSEQPVGQTDRQKYHAIFIAQKGEPQAEPDYSAQLAEVRSLLAVAQDPYVIWDCHYQEARLHCQLNPLEDGSDLFLAAVEYGRKNQALAAEANSQAFKGRLAMHSMGLLQEALRHNRVPEIAIASSAIGQSGNRFAAQVLVLCLSSEVAAGQHLGPKSDGVVTCARSYLQATNNNLPPVAYGDFIRVCDRIADEGLIPRSDVDVLATNWASLTDLPPDEVKKRDDALASRTKKLQQASASQTLPQQAAALPAPVGVRTNPVRKQ